MAKKHRGGSGSKFSSKGRGDKSTPPKYRDGFSRFRDAITGSKGRGGGRG